MFPELLWVLSHDRNLREEDSDAPLVDADELQVISLASTSVVPTPMKTAVAASVWRLLTVKNVFVGAPAA